MKSILWTTLTSCSLLVSGCAKISGDTYCDLTSPLIFDSDEVVDYLIESDTKLLRDIIIHNETHEKVC
jgi:hypothetical protein